ncbi:serine hydrolase [Sphingomonas sp.]|uniref:serine hydrolase n=1 Tax=Sphingomonas sp. TaxID=28214 RepID=UPI00257A97D3|nr:serine hydrolase [Sphingomonas sp.]
MKRILTAVILASVAFPVAALAAPPEGFEARVEALRRATGVPGMGVAIVENGAPVLVKGFGEKRIGSGEAVTAHTIFPTGSTGKAFTAAALALLVDQGKIGWDDRVIDHLPDFRMWDAWVTREITIRDLLVHRSGLGLGAGDLLFVPRSQLSRAETVRRLRYLKPVTSFRSAYAYDNVLYMVAGQLIEAVSGQRWEDFVREHVLRAAGMRDSVTDDNDRFASADRAQPHARMNGGLRGAGDQEALDERDGLGRNAAPAGGLAVSPADMATWLQIQLAHGKLPQGGQLFSPAQGAEMWKPVTPMPIGEEPEALKLTQPNFLNYALGWTVSDYRGARIIQHSGAVFGFQTIVVLVPEKNVGFAIEINSEDGEILRGLAYELLDHYLGQPANDWPAKFAAVKRQRVAAGLAAFKEKAGKPAKSGPSLPLTGYVGTYNDPWYGDIAVTGDQRGLRIDFKSTPRMSGRLEHFQYDSFVTRFDDKTIEPAYVTFNLDAEGKIARVTMKAASPIADFSYDYHDLLFTPVKGR